MLLVFVVLLIAITTPAQADPITATLFGTAFAISIPGQIVSFAIATGISLAIGAAASYLGSGGGQRMEQAEQDNGSLPSQMGVQIEERSGLLERRRIYGEQVVSGGVFFQKTIAGTGALDILVMGFTLSDGICDGLTSVIVGGIESAVDAFGNPQEEPWYNVAGNKFKTSFRSGAADQTMDPIIAARWPSPPDDFYPDEDDRVARWAKFRQRGVSTVVIEMHFGADSEEHTELWGAGGLPDVKFRVRGLKILDCRDPNASVDDIDTYTFTDNATLVQADWLMSDMGFEVPSDEIEWDSVKESANIDDVWVTTLAGSERRGRINGVVVGSEANDAVLSSMALQNRALIRRAFGEYSIRADRASEPVATIHQGIVVGALSFQNEPDTRAAINRGVAQFAPAGKFNQSAETVFDGAALLNAAGVPLLVADGQVLEHRQTLRFCDSSAAGQRLLFGAIKENRVGRTLTGSFDISVMVAPGKPNGQLLEAGDVVRVWFPTYPAMNGLYTVTGIEIAQDFTVNLALAGYDPDAINGWSVTLETPFEEPADG